MEALIQIAISLATSLILIGYKFGDLEKKIEKNGSTIKEQLLNNSKILEDELDLINQEMKILQSIKAREEEISELKMSRSEYELKQDLKLLKSQLNQIHKYLEKEGFKVRYIDRETLP